MKDHESRSADAASVAEEVRAFYERHPYPPPVDSLEKYRRLGQDRQRRRADYHSSGLQDPIGRTNPS